jgi:hypothetical protein
MNAIDTFRDNGANFSYDSKTGIWKFDVPYVVATLEELATFNPTFLPLGLPAGARRGGERKDGQWDLVISHEGAAGSIATAGFGEGSKDTAELDYITQEDPIETFEKFQDLATKYKARFASDDPDRLVGWPKTLLVDGKGGKNPLYGTTHFLNPAAIWRVTLVRQSLPSALLKDLRKICTPIIPSGLSNFSAPILETDQNWLKRSVKASYRGNVWVIVIEWQASGKGGWVKDIYG